ncbi:MAG: cation-translocating P-type ATPase [Oscillospiraceae bacterium]|nr:cation-translocating P-type ATPase [Oscillospiraceae bacterium]
MNWCALPISRLEKEFGINVKNGLCRKNVREALRIFGQNIIEKKQKKSIIRKFFEQLCNDATILILLFAGLISFITALLESSNDYVDTILIIAIVLLNTLIGLFQEEKAEKAIDALGKLTESKTLVIRDSREQQISTAAVVPGDVILLSAGNFVPADARVVESIGLETEESSLTGETRGIKKKVIPNFSSNMSLTSQQNMVFAGTSVMTGRGVAVVVKTGMNTQVGKIAGMINKVATSKTPLQKKLTKIGRILGIAAVVICVIVFVLGIASGIPLQETFMVSISLAVAVIPESLPAIITIVLAAGVRKLAKQKTIVRKLPAAETLGSVSVICSDKTGTLTENKMNITVMTDEKHEIKKNSKKTEFILTLASLCSNLKICKSFINKKVFGNQTEIAIVSECEKIGLKKSILDKKFKRLKEIPFDSKRKMMITAHKFGEKIRVIAKGAPDILLKNCVKTQTGVLDKTGFKKIKNLNINLAKQGLRILAVCYKDVNFLPKNETDLQKNLIFVGLLGMEDLPREGVKKAVKICKTAGIKPVMITGDQLETAKSVAAKIGFDKNGLSITGEELETLNQTQLIKNINKYSIFARTTPAHKMRIVQAFQTRGEIVAMTGDGVNDAPALKAADIGCAMGISGTDVAKGAADIIFADDNFSTIVEAVKQGRGIYDNIKKTIYFLLSSNIGEILTVLTSSLLNLPIPLLAIQLLWVNFITDSFPALALTAEPIDKNIICRKPNKNSANMFSRFSCYTMMVEGAFIGAISFLAFTIGKIFFDRGNDPFIGRSMAFTVLSLSQVFHVFNVRSDRSIFCSKFFSNKKLIFSFVLCVFLQFSVIAIPTIGRFFRTVQLSSLQWAIVLLLSVSPLLLVEIEKIIKTKVFFDRS